jgi:alpha-beta hydrolase superfamily lysophospholipase
MTKFLLIVMTVVVTLVTVTALLLGGTTLVQDYRSDQRQQALDPFYLAPDPIPRSPGTLIRTEPLTVDGDVVDIPGGSAVRMLYASQRPDGSPSVSGGMIFLPRDLRPGAPIVAWAHGTVGQGDACAPSRSANPLQDTGQWLEGMLDRGWVVAATDYTGLGTTGPNLYLVAEAEVRDVVNAVRAAQALTNAGESYVVWGHSQGGHAALWSGHLAPELAPELRLLGVAAAAPAAELTRIVRDQWQVPAWGWALGPEILESWPVIDPLLPTDVVTPTGLADAPRIAEECIIRAALEGTARGGLGSTFFSSDPMANEQWRALADQQTVRPLPASMPAFIGQSTTDTVVLASPNAALQETWCAAGSNLAMLWIGDVAHQQTASVIGPQVVGWIGERFEGLPAQGTCEIPPPITPGP